MIGSTRDTNKFHISFIFPNVFYRFLYHGDQNDLLIEYLAVNFEIHLCSSGMTTDNASFGVCASR